MKMYAGNLICNMTKKNPVISLDLRKSFFILYHQQYTRQSKNIGYVEMAGYEEGKKAVKKLNGKEINSRSLIVIKG